jgi:hypothetical protein
MLEAFARALIRLAKELGRIRQLRLAIAKVEVFGCSRYAPYVFLSLY